MQLNQFPVYIGLHQIHFQILSKNPIDRIQEIFTNLVSSPIRIPIRKLKYFFEETVSAIHKLNLVPVNNLMVFLSEDI